MNKLRPYFITSSNYGLAGGAIIIILFLILQLFNINPMVANKKMDFGFIILPLFVFFAIKEFRDFKNNRQLRFWQGMTVGFFTYIILALNSAIFLWLVLGIISPELLDQYIIDRTLLIESKKNEIMGTLGEDVYYQTHYDLQNVTPFVLALDDFLKKTFAGLFITIIISVILRK
jgi:hypothetical protein